VEGTGQGISGKKKLLRTITCSSGREEGDYPKGRAVGREGRSGPSRKKGSSMALGFAPGKEGGEKRTHWQSDREESAGYCARENLPSRLSCGGKKVARQMESVGGKRLIVRKRRKNRFDSTSTVRPQSQRRRARERGEGGSKRHIV